MMLYMRSRTQLSQLLPLCTSMLYLLPASVLALEVASGDEDDGDGHEGQLECNVATVCVSFHQAGRCRLEERTGGKWRHEGRAGIRAGVTVAAECRCR